MNLKPAVLKSFVSLCEVYRVQNVVGLELMIKINDKGTFIAPYLLRAHRLITYFTTKRENLMKHYTLFMLKCLRNKNVFKSVLNISTEFAALSEYGSSFQRHGAT